MKIRITVALLLLAGLSGCNSPVNVAALDRSGSAHFTRWDSGSIDVRVQKASEGAYEIKVIGAPATSMEKALSAWKAVAEEIANGRLHKVHFETHVGYPENAHPLYANMGHPDHFFVDGEVTIESEKKG